ncbi:MAG: hypothetical protein ABSD31_19360 [Candidatus Binataceae bacterium]
MRNWGTIFILLLMSFAGATSNAAAQTVHVLGCVKPGVEFGCLIITDRNTGKSYEIGSAIPRPDPAQNLVVDLKGQVFHGVSFCMQGPILREITWNYTKMSCRLRK